MIGMNRIRHRLSRVASLLLLVLPAAGFAAGGSTYPLDDMAPDVDNHGSLQRGAQVYMNYCMGCHSLKYQRYERTADDLGVPHYLMLEHLVFDPNVKIGALMENSMNPDHAKSWFGVAPPDLTLQTNLRGGPEWLYTYLRTFYRDDTRPFGVNNLVFPNVGMPHALLELQGMQVPGCPTLPMLDWDGDEIKDPVTGSATMQQVCSEDDLHARDEHKLTLVEGTGTLTPREYDQVAYDLSNFLYYIAEPSRQDRHSLGIYVLLFLAVFFVFTLLLEREYWKDIH